MGPQHSRDSLKRRTWPLQRDKNEVVWLGLACADGERLQLGEDLGDEGGVWLVACSGVQHVLVEPEGHRVGGEVRDGGAAGGGVRLDGDVVGLEMAQGDAGEDVEVARVVQEQVVWQGGEVGGCGEDVGRGQDGHGAAELDQVGVVAGGAPVADGQVVDGELADPAATEQVRGIQGHGLAAAWPQRLPQWWPYSYG
jgi:hypothetical protein